MNKEWIYRPSEWSGGLVNGKGGYVSYYGSGTSVHGRELRSSSSIIMKVNKQNKG